MQLSNEELLIEAAKATGKEWRLREVPAYDYPVPCFSLVDTVNDVEYWPGWNPIEDTDDAMQLVAHFGLTLSIESQNVSNARITIYWLGDELASAPRGEDAIKTARFLITSVVANHFAKN